MITQHIQALSLEREKELVRRAQEGESKACHLLLEAHYQKMYNLALKITRDPNKAEDITQEASVQVLRQIKQFRSESRISSWIHRIVFNSALLRHRREKRMVPTAEIFSPLAISTEPLPEKRAADRELLSLTHKLLLNLRAGDRELFIRRFIDGLSLKSISHETGISLPALKSRFHRARQRLKATPEFGFAT